MLRVAKLYIVLRLLLAALKPDLWKLLDTFVELSTPVSSFTRLSEGLYLYEKLQISPYSGGPCHQSPLLLAIFSFVPQKLSFIVFLIADVVAATALTSFAARYTRKISFTPETIAAVYLFNPYSLLSSLSQSTNGITNALVCVALAAASDKRHGARAMVLLSIATSLSWYPAYYVSAFIILIKQNSVQSAFKLIGVFIASMLACLGLAYVPTRSWDFMESQFGTLLLLKDLTRPNIGLWWYFFIELFDFFRPFFLGAFQLVVVSFTAPLTLRFPDQPLFVVASLSGIFAILKPYPEASDLGLYISLLVLDKPVFDLLEYRAFEALGMCYVTVLAPAFYHLWIYVGSGNANFFYAITLVYSVTVILMLADSTWAAIRIGYDGGKAKNLTQI